MDIFESRDPIIPLTPGTSSIAALKLEGTAVAPSQIGTAEKKVTSDSPISGCPGVSDAPDGWTVENVAPTTVAVSCTSHVLISN